MKLLKLGTLICPENKDPFYRFISDSVSAPIGAHSLMKHKPSQLERTKTSPLVFFQDR
jgi:hypothetical protein